MRHEVIAVLLRKKSLAGILAAMLALGVVACDVEQGTDPAMDPGVEEDPLLEEDPALEGDPGVEDNGY